MAKDNGKSWTNKAATLATFRAILRDSKRKNAFDTAWLNSVASTVQRQRGILVGVMAVSFVPTAYLALFLLGKATDVEFFSFKFEDLSTAFEVSLLATCLLGVYGARVAILTAQGEQLIDAWMEHTLGSAAARLYTYAFDPPLLRPPAFNNPPDMQPTSRAIRLRECAFGTFYSVAGAVGLAALMTQIWAIWWAINQSLGFNCRDFAPAIRVCDAREPSLAIVAFCACVTLLNVLAYVPYALRQSFEHTD